MPSISFAIYEQIENVALSLKGIPRCEWQVMSMLIGLLTEMTGNPVQVLLCCSIPLQFPGLAVKTMSNSGQLSGYSGRITALQLNSRPLRITPVPDMHIPFR